MQVLCHEMAHIFQNHEVSERDSLVRDNEASRAQSQNDTAKARFYQQTYAENIYKHSADDWKKAWTTIGGNQTILSKWRRKNEFIADSLGAVICAKLGMGPEAYIYGLSDALKNIQQQHKNTLMRKLPEWDHHKVNQVVDQNQPLGSFLSSGRKLSMSPLDMSFVVLREKIPPPVPERITQLRNLLGTIHELAGCQKDSMVARKFIESYDRVR